MMLEKPAIIMIDSLIGNDYSLFLCNAIKRCGTDITLYIPRNKKLKGDEIFTIKYVLPSKQENKNRIVKAIQYAKYIISIFLQSINKPDIIHFQFFRRPYAESILFYLMSKAGAKLVYTVHDIEPPNSRKSDMFFRRIVYNSASALIVHSGINRRMLEKYTSNKNIRIINHGSYEIISHNSLLSKHCAREKLGLNDENDVLLFFGFLKEYKGLDLLLEAFKTASVQNKKLILLIAGVPESEKLNRLFIEQINSISASARIIFHNRYIGEDEIPIYFISADMTILPYKNISHSGVLHLSYSFGIPVIVTDTGDLAYLVNEHNSGLTAQKNNPSDIAGKISEAFADKAKLLRMGKNALNVSRTEYSWDNSARQTIELYKSLTNKKS